MYGIIAIIKKIYQKPLLLIIVFACIVTLALTGGYLSGGWFTKRDIEKSLSLRGAVIDTTAGVDKAIEGTGKTVADIKQSSSVIGNGLSGDIKLAVSGEESTARTIRLLHEAIKKAESPDPGSGDR